MSLSYKQVRISPRQGTFDDSGSTNIVDVELPGGNYDLSQSSLVIDCLVHHTSDEAVVNGGGDNSGVSDLFFCLKTRQIQGTTSSCRVKRIT